MTFGSQSGATVAAPPPVVQTAVMPLEVPEMAPEPEQTPTSDALSVPSLGDLVVRSLSAQTSLFNGAENGTAGLIIDNASDAFEVIQSTEVFDGSNGFHLANPGFADTSIVFPAVEVTAGAGLTFASKIGIATSSQIATVQVSTDNGASFPTTLWSKAGTNSGSTSSGTDSGYELVEVDLSAYLGQEIVLRFILDLDGSSAFTGTGAHVGWTFDNVAVGIGGGKVLYSIGNPTDLEQLNLELINRSRADALAEADRLIALANGGDADVVNAVTFNNITPADIRTQYEWLINNGHMDSVAQPLAFNANLIDAARQHSADMLLNTFQAHESSQNPPPGVPYAPGASSSDRVTANGYSWSRVGESIFASSESVLYGHAAFLIDWGIATDTGSDAYNPDFAGQGMQNPAGHRLSNHNGAYKEVGIGIVEGSDVGPGSTQIGPQLVTQNFGTDRSSTTFITGVALMDFDNDHFFDPGEGLPNVHVDVAAANPNTPTPAHYAITTDTGGYSVPVPGDGTYTLTFTDTFGNTHTENVAISGGLNVKVDYIPELLVVLGISIDDTNGTHIEVKILDAGLSTPPKLTQASDLTSTFTDVGGTSLSPRDGNGHRTLTHSAPGAPMPDQVFYRVEE